MSIALRIYPAGLASLRLGLFLQTATSFQIQDMIDFLANKNAVVTMGNQSYNIDKLTKEFAHRLSAGLLKDKQTIYAEEDTFSMVTIIGSDPYPTFQNNLADVFLPLLLPVLKEWEGAASLLHASAVGLYLLRVYPRITIPLQVSGCFVVFLALTGGDLVWSKKL